MTRYIGAGHEQEGRARLEYRDHGDALAQLLQLAQLKFSADGEADEGKREQ